jgi:hypothetical protein
MTSRIVLLSLRWGSRDAVLAGLVGIRWVQSVGLIPFKSWSEYPKTDLCFSRMAMSLNVSSSVSLSLMITGVICRHSRKRNIGQQVEA